MANATLTISSKNYSSWSLRGWLLCKMAGLDFEERQVAVDDINARRELLLLSPSVLVPRLTHGDVIVWDTLRLPNTLMKSTRTLESYRTTAPNARAVEPYLQKCIRAFTICVQPCL